MWRAKIHIDRSYCNMCGYVPHKNILLPSNKKDGSSSYILVYFLIQPIHFFFLLAAYIKCSLVCQVCQGCVCDTVGITALGCCELTLSVTYNSFFSSLSFIEHIN